MVKNTKGGNKAKKQARKSSQPVDASSVKARYSTDPDEVYACCSKLLGNGTCSVMCIDGIERLCIIRNKFRGRGKRGNVLAPGTWCLIGRRDFERPKEGKLEKTDLLEVYGDIEKKLIIQKEVALKDKWKLFNSISRGPMSNVGDEEEDSMFQQSLNMPESEEESDEEEVSQEEEETPSNYSYKAHNLGDKIDIDDI